ncbi:MAG: hypothetical protein ACREOE_05355, partial [Gemmatimonadales bacterium]
HLGITLTTQFSPNGGGLLPLRGHGAVEAIVGIALLALPLAAGWTGRARVFYLIAGAVILVVSAVSKYRVEQPSSIRAAV